MDKLFALVSGLFAFLCAVAITPSHAAIITKVYTLNASGFDASAPVGVVTLSFLVTLDTDHDVESSSANFKVYDFSLSDPNSLSFGYTSFNSIFSVATHPKFGGFFGNGGELFFGVNIHDFSGSNPTVNVVEYGLGDGIFHTGTGTLTVFDPPASVPEPATWAMFIAGFGAVGAVKRRKLLVINVSSFW